MCDSRFAFGMFRSKCWQYFISCNKTPDAIDLQSFEEPEWQMSSFQFKNNQRQTVQVHAWRFSDTWGSREYSNRFLRLASIHQFRSQSAHNTNTFCTKLQPLHAGRLFSPYRVLPNVFNPTFQLVFGVPWAASSASHTPIPPPDSESQLRIAMLHKPPLLRHISSVQRRSLFCQVICFLIAFNNELFEERHFLHGFHLAGAWERANDEEETALVTKYFCRVVSRDPTPGMDTLLLQCNANC